MNEPPDLFELRLDRLVRVIDRAGEQDLQVASAARHHRATSDGRRARIDYRRCNDTIYSLDSYPEPVISMSNYAPHLLFASLLQLGSKAKRAAHHFSSSPEEHTVSQPVASSSARGKNVWRGLFQSGDTHRHSDATDARLIDFAAAEGR